MRMNVSRHRWLPLTLLLLAFCVVSCGTTPEQTSKPTATSPAVKPTVTKIPVSQPTAPPSSVSAGLPTKLSIPAINVNAPVEEVGIMPNGDMATPTKNEWEGVGWYRSGTRPGEKGTAVIAGHLDRPGGSPAVFWDLKQLKAGDKVTVTDNKGKAYTYQVERVEAYPADEAPLQEIFGAGGGTYLNLITCAGVYDPSKQETTERLVAYTKLV